MAEFPESLIGTNLVYFLPKFKPKVDAATEGLMHPLEGEKFVLTFTDSAENVVRQADQIINARFLPYVEKYSTVCPVQNSDCLSGPFTGCWFIRFMKPGLGFHIAHIGTTGNVADSTNVKSAFVDYAEVAGIYEVSCFNPHHVWNDAEILNFCKDPNVKGWYNLCYLTAEGKCYSIGLVINKNNKNLITRSKVMANFPTRPDPEKKSTWKNQNINVHNPTSNAKVGLSYTVVGVREIKSRTWGDIKTELRKGNKSGIKIERP